MTNKKITALTTDAADMQSATNISYVKNEVNLSATNIITTLTDRFDRKINQSHISSSTNKKDVFRYLMEDADESSSEHDIIVDGIIDFSGSPHNVNKKAYSFRIGKGPQNQYSSRIGFNMFKLLEGEYTLAIEFFPPSMTNLSVDVVSTSLNIGQATKLFPNYSRSIVHLHKWRITPPEYIYIDLKFQGTASSDAQGTGYLIVYGIKGSQNDVDSAVYDTAYIVENSKIVMQTDIDMNNHKINVPQFITGYYKKSKHPNRIFLNGVKHLQIIPYNCRLTEIACYFYATQSSDLQISLNVRSIGQKSNTTLLNSTQNARLQNFTSNIQLFKNDILGIEIYKMGTYDNIVPSGAVFGFV